MNRSVFFLLCVSLAGGCGGDDPANEPATEAPPTVGIDGRPADALTPGMAPPPLEGYIAYSGARIWDGTGSAIQEDKNLVTQGGSIVGIFDGIPEGTEVIDVSGAWIVPGFVNAHGHVSGYWADESADNSLDRVRGDLSLYARYGVTSVISLGGELGEVLEIRDGQETPDLAHARLKVAGSVVVGDTPEEAVAMVRDNITDGVDWIKLRVDDNLGNSTKMPWDTVKAAIDAARIAERPVATHIFYLEDAARVLQMGSGLIAHSVRDQTVSDEFVQTLIGTGVCYVPTLTREVSTYVYETRPEFFDDPFFADNAKQSEIDRVSDPQLMARIASSPASVAYKQALQQAQENLKIVADAGAPVAFGTDTGPPGRFLGYFEHMEFDLMAEAGLSPEQILLSATSVAADCVHLEDVGTLEAGKWADFVVLNENPMRDVKALHSIRDVFIAGNAIE